LTGPVEDRLPARLVFAILGAFVIRCDLSNVLSITLRLPGVELALSKISRILFIILDIALLVYIISDIARSIVPVEQALFWLAAAIEIALGYLTYITWMRSTLGKKYFRYRIIAVCLLILGIFLPILFSSMRILEATVTSDRFYIATVLTLLIYSSFIIKKYQDSNRKP
jgi:hypothetical protein